jgi:hypothetical protein
VSGTTELPIETLNELQPRKVRTRAFCQWPEWKALIARLGVPKHHTRVVLDVSLDEGVRLTVTTIGVDHSPCPTHPAVTHHTDSSEAEQKPAHHQPSVGTTATGRDSEDCS